MVGLEVLMSVGAQEALSDVGAKAIATGLAIDWGCWAQE